VILIVLLVIALVVLCAVILAILLGLPVLLVRAIRVRIVIIVTAPVVLSVTIYMDYIRIKPAFRAHLIAEIVTRMHVLNVLPVIKLIQLVCVNLVA